MDEFSLCINDNLEGWNEALAKIMAIPSYRKFFEITSPFPAVIVKNFPDLKNASKEERRAANREFAAMHMQGYYIDGWQVVCDYTHHELVKNVCRLIHHRNILMPNGDIVNSDDDNGRSHHIFIRDEKRLFDHHYKIGYNIRLLFGDDFQREQGDDIVVTRNKVYFSSGPFIDSDPKFEKFKVYPNFEFANMAMPRNLSEQEQAKWMAMKTNFRID